MFLSHIFVYGNARPTTREIYCDRDDDKIKIIMMMMKMMMIMMIIIIIIIR
jgi:hypothetical protein